MALIKCKECGAQVSNKAKACPSCGAKVPKSVGVIGWL
ncbi:TPA: zinc-ribbon domain-containing protein, partial [Pseudomonas aeruginosa]|nr:zinc-ribbon domain-containing protein [Pseudomonas aeruginosa]